MKHQIFTTFQTNDGQTITVRRILPADINQLVYIFRNLSEESVYQRFREPGTNLSPMRVLETARTLAEEASSRGKGFIAFADLPGRPGTPIAGARYIRTDKTTAEVAITVIDAFQKKGVGSKLIEILFEEARQDGIRTLTANVSATNSAVLRMLSRYAYPQKRVHFGSEIAIEFDLMDETIISPPAAVSETAMGPGPRPQIQPACSERSAQPVPGGRM